MNQHMEPLPNHPAQFHGDLIDQGKCYVYPQTKNWHDAEDLVQQAWLKLKTKYEEVKDRALLFRAIRNLFIDGTRRRKIVAFKPLENAYHLGKTEGRGASRDIEEALSALSPAERDSIVLNVFKGTPPRKSLEGRECLEGRFSATFIGAGESSWKNTETSFEERAGMSLCRKLARTSY